MVECIIALVLTTVAVVSILSAQSLAWRGAGKSDYMGRAVGLLQRELERNEYDIMKGAPPADSQTCTDKDSNVVACNAAGALYTINIATSTPASIPAGTRLLNVRVRWPGSRNGLSSSVIVSPQPAF